MAFLLSLKSHEKKTWSASFYFMTFSWFFLFVRVFHGPWSVEYWGDFNAFFMRFSRHIHGIFSWKTHENSPLNSPEKPMKNMWIYHEKIHWTFMGFNFIVLCGSHLQSQRVFYDEDDYRTGCRNVSHCQQQHSYSGLRSPGRSNSTYFWYDTCETFFLLSRYKNIFVFVVKYRYILGTWYACL